MLFSIVTFFRAVKHKLDEHAIKIAIEQKEKIIDESKKNIKYLNKYLKYKKKYVMLKYQNKLSLNRSRSSFIPFNDHYFLSEH